MSDRTPRAPGPRRDRKAAKPTARKPEAEPPQPERRPAPEAEPDEEVQRRLDEALADSFPASDPVSIVTSQHEEAWQKDRERK